MIKLRTKSGRISRSQKWQIVSIIVHGVTAAGLVAAGLPAQYAPLANMVIGIAQGLVAMRMRTITSEPMQ